jgi:hypothetical protein
MEQWKEIVNSKKAAPRYQAWTDEDERKLNHLETSKIDISETAVGRAASTIQREYNATFDKMNKDQQKDAVAQWQKRIDDV